MREIVLVCLEVNFILLNLKGFLQKTVIIFKKKNYRDILNDFYLKKLI